MEIAEVELHPDLQKCVFEESFGQSLKHPLLFGVPYAEEWNQMYNQQYEYKQKAITEARQNNDWSAIVGLHERPHRFDALESIMYSEDLSNEEYWELFAFCWTDSENLFQIYNLEEFLHVDRAGRESMMSKSEKALFDALPEVFPVYRGHGAFNEDGHSWTLSYSKACWFAERYARSDDVKTVSSARCLKDWVIAIFLGRGEYEVIVECPDMLEDVEEIQELERDRFLTSMLEIAKSEFKLGGRSDHGPFHWGKVERNVLHLADEMFNSELDVLTCRLFAIFHDCKRKNEMDDPEHGKRAAEFLTSVRDGIVDKIGVEGFNKLKYACEHHNSGQTSDDPIIGTCWDADRLDLIRVGIVPDPDFMSTNAGIESILK